MNNLYNTFSVKMKLVPKPMFQQSGQTKLRLLQKRETVQDLQERIDHIFHKQLYGIAITELTSLLSRRSVYCSKYPNSKYSVTKFDNAEGNIRFKRVDHIWGSEQKDAKGEIQT